MTQYQPDVITMQENDHYYDFFLPELAALGYDGFFAPKPASACLEVRIHTFLQPILSVQAAIYHEITSG